MCHDIKFSRVLSLILGSHLFFGFVYYIHVKTGSPQTLLTTILRTIDTLFAIVWTVRFKNVNFCLLIMTCEEWKVYSTRHTTEKLLKFLFTTHIFFYI